MSKVRIINIHRDHGASHDDDGDDEPFVRYSLEIKRAIKFGDAVISTDAGVAGTIRDENENWVGVPVLILEVRPG